MQGRVLGTALVAALALAGAAAVATAGETDLGTEHGLRYLSESGEIPLKGTPSEPIRAGCPIGARHVTGGGAQLGETTHPGTPGELGATAPFGPALSQQRGWEMKALNDGTDPQAAFAFAICSADKLEYVRRRAVLKPAGKAARASASCPEGTHVAGGGVWIAGEGGRVVSSYPFDSRDRGHKPDDGWRGTAYNTSLFESHRMFVYAACWKRAMRYTKLTVPMDPGDAISISVECPGAITGGGVRIRGQAAATRLTISIPEDGTDAGAAPGDAWRIATSTGPAEVKAILHAACLS